MDSVIAKIIRGIVLGSIVFGCATKEPLTAASTYTDTSQTPGDLGSLDGSDSQSAADATDGATNGADAADGSSSVDDGTDGTDSQSGVDSVDGTTDSVDGVDITPPVVVSAFSADGVLVEINFYENGKEDKERSADATARFLYSQEEETGITKKISSIFRGED